MSKTTTATQVLQQPCASWCAYQEDRGYFDEPGICTGVELRTSVSLYPAIKYPLGHIEPDQAAVYAARADGQDQVVIARLSGTDLRLTLDEAHQVIESVQLVLGQIESAR